LENPYQKASVTKGLLAAMNEGTVSIPHLLIKYYHQLKLADVEVMLLIHILTFKEKEHNDFPTIEEIQKRMTSSPEVVINTIQKLMKEGFLAIDEEIDADSGIQYERYNLQQTFVKLANSYANELEIQRENAAQLESSRSDESINSASGAAESGLKKESKNIFTVFEKEFARPLSPMECETISSWIDQDGYIEELILAGLKEAVFAGKLHFRYIDRILLEWSRNRVHNVQQAKEFTQNFRGTR
jgi:DNA replication protein